MKVFVKATIATCGFIGVWYAICEIAFRYPFVTAMVVLGLIITYCLYKVFTLFVDLFKMIEEDKTRRKKYESKTVGLDW